MRVILLSGGIDSTVLAYSERPELALTVDYGQRAANSEIQAATIIASELAIEHRVIRIDCSAIGAGDMSTADTPLRVGTPSEWWPYRNQLLITFAAASLVNFQPVEILVGTVRSDEVHADGRRAFFKAINSLLGTQEGFTSVKAPGITKTTEELIEAAGVPAGLLGWTFSCHRGNLACGACRGCLKRRAALLATRRQV